MITRKRASAPLPGWLALVACIAALVLALRNPDASADTAPLPPPPTPAPSGSTISPAPTGSVISPAPAPSTLFDAPPDTAAATRSGSAAMRGDAEVPLVWMPPGTGASPLPSEEIFPPQTIPLRFNHKKHVKELKQPCKVCHAAAFASNDVADRLLPRPTESCDGCHATNHADLLHVTAGAGAIGQCEYCHLGANAGEGGKVAAVVIPTPNLHFPHKKHLGRNIQCAQCHGKIEELELATREQMPRMAGCLTCHAMSGPAQGGAKSACSTCHLTQADGRMQVAFSTGDLLPPRWLHDAGHAADWIERHKTSAANDSAFCGSCHTDKYCADCHDGKVRPRKVHPNDWLSMHPQAARQDSPRCVSCHQEQTFCADCHRRTGVARDAASGNRMAGRRFHLPPEVWTTAPRGPQHHAWEAERNLNACV
ncbi:MAG: cytochrome c3 family protein, partial [Byssovorax sp.]